MSADAIRRYTAEIVTSYLKRHDIEQERVPEVITIVHSALTSLTQPADAQEIKPRAPAIAIRRSVTNEYIICLDCGFRGKMLRRHLKLHGLTPEGYRKKWNLPQDYPVTAPGYAASRSDMAKKIGLGRFGGTRLLDTADHVSSAKEDDQ